jgi:hypothetical protein
MRVKWKLQSSGRTLGGSMDVSVDVRLIASISRGMKKMVAKDQFRVDFYYCVSSNSIYLAMGLPPSGCWIDGEETAGFTGDGREICH